MARTLATIAINQVPVPVAATARLKDPQPAKTSELDKAQDALAHGIQEAARGHYQEAVDWYGDAWAHAQKAMNKNPEGDKDCQRRHF